MKLPGAPFQTHFWDNLIVTTDNMYYHIFGIKIFLIMLTMIVRLGGTRMGYTLPYVVLGIHFTYS